MAAAVLEAALLSRPAPERDHRTTGLAPFQTLQERRYALAVELAACAFFELRAGFLLQERGSVRTVFRHRPVGIADGDDSSAERDRASGQAVGIPGSVPALVVMANDREDRLKRLDRPEDVLADLGVRLHHGPFVFVERSGVV